jgi:hypothetical protein
MKTVYCKSKKTYTNDCECEDSAKCPAYWKQGIGSLIENGVSNVNNTSTPRTTSTSNG